MTHHVVAKRAVSRAGRVVAGAATVGVTAATLAVGPGAMRDSIAATTCSQISSCSANASVSLRS
jgi:hypothetical protein